MILARTECNVNWFIFLVAIWNGVWTVKWVEVQTPGTEMNKISLMRATYLNMTFTKNRMQCFEVYYISAIDKKRTLTTQNEIYNAIFCKGNNPF